MKRSEISEFASTLAGAGASLRDSSVAGSLAALDGVDRSAVQEWLRVHRMLVQQEAAFSEIAMRAAAGEISVDELHDERDLLMAMRALCMAVYEKAFPKPPRP